MSGPDFTQKTKEILAQRAGQVCSNPDCDQHTSGPHSEEAKAVNLGEAAHIRSAREGQARYDPNMTDEERRDISNGIWLCRKCARYIDLDEERFPVVLLNSWKQEHEASILASRSSDDSAAREVFVKDGGIGSIVENTGEGIALEIIQDAEGPAERITVEGSGIGEIVTNVGRGTAKRVIATGGGPALESSVIVNKPVQMAVGMSVTTVLTTCGTCGRNVQLSKVVEAFAGDSEPEIETYCPYCGASISI